MKPKKLHIIAFNVPYPADYGGVIDIYYKIKALKEAGIGIYLHAYKYGRAEAQQLEALCEKVYYYERKTLKNPFYGSLPYIVKTRNSNEILNNLLQDENPILFEGLHSCYYLDHPALKDRKKIVRMHNIEYLYYWNLAKVENNPLKRIFFYREAQKLQEFHKVLKHADKIAAISPDEHLHLDVKFNNCFYLPVYHPNDHLQSKNGQGNFVFYHGNLGVPENNEAALYLINQVFNDIDKPLVIAGMNPSRALKKAADKNPNVTLIENVDSQKIFELIEEAQINILPTFQTTGIKIKLINVLYRGRHCITVPEMVKGTGLESLVKVGRNPEELKSLIHQYFQKPFNGESIECRKEVLSKHFCTKNNTQKLVHEVFSS